MENYNQSSEAAKQMIFSFLKKRMQEKNISEPELAKLIAVNKSTLLRNFKGETEMLLSTYLKICGALEIRPYLIPAEMDKNEMQRMFFN